MLLFTYKRAAWVRKAMLCLFSATLATSLVAVSGCSELSGPSESSSSVSGTYTLADVGGNRLPATIYEGPYTINGQRVNLRLAVQTATLQLNGDRYVFSVGMIANIAGQTAPLPINDQGSYTKNGNQLAFKSDDPKVGSFAGNISQAGVGILIDFVGDQHPPVYQFRK